MDLLTIPTDPLQLMMHAQQGVSKGAVKQLQERLQFSNEQLAHVLHLTVRALQKYEPEKMLKPSISERAIALAQLYARGFELLGEERFLRWMQRAHVALGKRKPTDLLSTQFGMMLIRDELGRIEHGVLA